MPKPNAVYNDGCFSLHGLRDDRWLTPGDVTVPSGGGGGGNHPRVVICMGDAPCLLEHLSLDLLCAGENIKADCSEMERSLGRLISEVIAVNVPVTGYPGELDGLALPL